MCCVLIAIESYRENLAGILSIERATELYARRRWSRRDRLANPGISERPDPINTRAINLAVTPRLVIIRRKEKTKVGIILSAVQGGEARKFPVGKGACFSRILPVLWKLTYYSASFLLCAGPLFPKEGIALIIMAACNRRLFWSRNRFPPKKIGGRGRGGRRWKEK